MGEAFEPEAWTIGHNALGSLVIVFRVGLERQERRVILTAREARALADDLYDATRTDQ